MVDPAVPVEIPQHIIEAAQVAGRATPPVFFSEIRIATTDEVADAVLAAVWPLIETHVKGEAEWEYGYHAQAIGWITEARGENYALHRRRVWRGPAEWIDGTEVFPSVARGAARDGDDQ